MIQGFFKIRHLKYFCDLAWSMQQEELFSIYTCDRSTFMGYLMSKLSLQKKNKDTI